MENSYYDIQQFIWKKLNEHRKTTLGFNFSVRRKFPEKARDQYFIGVEKSGYFGFTFWFVPFYFRGASTDFINYMFQRRRDGKWDCHLQVVSPRNTVDRQMELCLYALNQLAGTLKQKYSNLSVTPDENKVATLRIHTHAISPDEPEELWQEFLKLYNTTAPLIDNTIAEIKAKFPEWSARRRDDAEFEKHYNKLLQRKDLIEAQRMVQLMNDSDFDEAEEMEEFDTLRSEIYSDSLIGEEVEKLNQIFYGSPGTGKTYKTVRSALELIDQALFESAANRGEMRDLFSEYQNKKRIFMCTFHPSLTYEDFVEGLRPVPRDDDSVGYEVKAGIFKQACAHAAWECYRVWRQNEARNVKKRIDFDVLYEAWLDEIQTELDKSNKYLLKTLKGNPIEIVRINSQDSLITQAENSRRKNKSVPKTKVNIRKLYEKISDPGTVKSLSEIYEIINTRPGLTAYYAVLKGLYEFESKLNAQQLESYQKRHDETDDIVESFSSGVYDDAVLNTSKRKQPVPAVVLIIDEISRGNTAAVFGELITLLESNKRLGNSEGTRLILPASQLPFYIPHNLFVIGTMNTADRSVIALDAALRRRFHFEEILPQPEKVSPAALLYDLLSLEKASMGESPNYLSRRQDLFELIDRPEELNDDILKNLVVLSEFFESDIDIEQLNKYAFTGIHLNKILAVINNRLELLIGRDAQFGHSYLMKAFSIKKVKDVFFGQFIPQFQEWFMNDNQKIKAVIGNQFFRNTLSMIDTEVDWPFADSLEVLHTSNSMSDTEFVQALRHIQNAYKP